VYSSARPYGRYVQPRFPALCLPRAGHRIGDPAYRTLLGAIGHERWTDFGSPGECAI